MLTCQVCLLGPPASGKGTIGLALQQAFNYHIITPGDIYRRLREENTELGNLVRESLKDGGYCPNELTNKIILDETANISDTGIILDGYPRTMEQFIFLQKYFNVKCFLHIHAPYDMLFQAAINRIQCNKCLRIWSKLLPEDECCKCLDNDWLRRFDDSEDMYPKRYASYQELTQPIIDKVKNRINYKKIQSFNNNDAINETLDWIKSITNHDSLN